MKVRVLPRRGGKTAEMIRLAAEEFLYIVCPDQAEARRIAGEAERLGLDIPFPLTFSEFRNHDYYGKGIKGFAIDNVDMFVQSMTHVPVRAVTLTGEETVT